MAFGRIEPQYELLNGHKKPVVYALILIGLAVLVSFVVILMFNVSWIYYSNCEEHNTSLDLSTIFGPETYLNPDIILQRSKIVAYAAKSDHDVHWPANQTVNLKKRVEKSYNLLCYYSLPSGNSSNLLPSKINATLCTHIIIAAAQVQNNSVYIKSSFEENIIKQVVNLRGANPQLKVLLSLIYFSNGKHSVDGFSSVVNNLENMEKFLENVKTVIDNYDLDGIDIDWEFPSWPLLNLKEKYGFAKLLELLRNKLPDSILSAAVAAPLNIIDSSYEIYALASFLDFINVMTYDYHSYQWYFPITGPNSPLFSSRNEIGYFKTLNVKTSIQYWISKGIPKEKILIGMPTYGHSFKLINKNHNGFGAPASSNGIGKDGFLSFSEACEFISNKKAVTIFDNETHTPYSYYEKDWISFDNEISLAYKAKFAVSLGLGGAMMFSLNDDDYLGSSPCSLTEFPLTSRVKTVLNDDYL
ncbi:chitinase-3-like protein 2 [Daktulosphaira vitifoliae]|uniref:chitinase-3-like protein 2 n=1 Tax=Daktulosphaira vitifoliae TaxID=58002 RepID=UPI0021A9C4EB|nr:chitinase-3-like protein 2 [Daktulosphaira vitifoliae]